VPDDTYAKLVLSQIESLTGTIDVLRNDILFVRQEIAEIKAREDKVVELKEWKQRIDEIASPPQLNKLMNEVEELQKFKTKAITVFAVAQSLMAVLVGMAKIVI
jgi:hypothetical protein